MILLTTQALASRRQSLVGCESSRDGSIFAWSTFNSRLSQKQKIANKDPKDQKKTHPFFFNFEYKLKNTLFSDFEYKLMKTTFFQNREHAKKKKITRNLERSCVHEVNTEWQHRAPCHTGFSMTQPYRALPFRTLYSIPWCACRT